MRPILTRFLFCWVSLSCYVLAIVKKMQCKSMQGGFYATITIKKRRNIWNKRLNNTYSLDGAMAAWALAQQAFFAKELPRMTHKRRWGIVPTTKQHLPGARPKSVGIPRCRSLGPLWLRHNGMLSVHCLDTLSLDRGPGIDLEITLDPWACPLLEENPVQC